MKMRLKYISLIIIICLASTISFSQGLKALPELEIGYLENDSISLSKNVLLTIKMDPDYLYHVLTFKRDEIEELVDSVGLTNYGFNFRFFELRDNNAQLLIAEAEHEYLSEYPIYLIDKTEIMKIGELSIGLDGINYPLNDIIIKGNQDKIEFSFLRNLVLIIGERIEKKQRDEIRYVYKFDERELKIE
jgi:hypothetical protein